MSSEKNKFDEIKFWKFNTVMMFIWFGVTLQMLLFGTLSKISESELSTMNILILFGIVVHLAGNYYILKDVVK